MGSDPITGKLSVGEDLPISFCGWIELVAAIETVRHTGDLETALVSGPGTVASALG